MPDEPILTDLLTRGDRSEVRGSRRVIRTVIKDDSDFYWALSLPNRDALHERLRAAAKAGAVELTWSRQGGADKTIQIVTLRDTFALARFLGASTTQDDLGKARDVLLPWLETSDRLKQIIQTWGQRKTVRSLGPSSANYFAEALIVLDALNERNGDDQVLRRLSVSLFRDSKRIEKLHRHLDLLTSESLLAPARSAAEVFNQLGLTKEPQPFLVAGQGTLHLAEKQRCQVLKPFIGVSGKDVTGYQGDPAWVLTIENLTTFHLCSQMPAADEGLIIYTGGMPSPSWVRSFTTIVSDLPLDTPVYHWGDVDVGGFRISAYLRTCLPPERAFLPWMMDLASQSTSEASAADQAELNGMKRQALLSGWLELAERLVPLTLEQEALAPTLPNDERWSTQSELPPGSEVLIVAESD